MSITINRTINRQAFLAGASIFLRLCLRILNTLDFTNEERENARAYLLTLVNNALQSQVALLEPYKKYRPGDDYYYRLSDTEHISFTDPSKSGKFSYIWITFVGPYSNKKQCTIESGFSVHEIIRVFKIKKFRLSNKKMEYLQYFRSKLWALQR